MGPKSGNVEKPWVFKAFLKGSKKPRAFQEHELNSGPGRLGGGRGRVNPPPRRLVWRFWEVWRVCCLVGASTRLEARGLGGFRTVASPLLELAVLTLCLTAAKSNLFLVTEDFFLEEAISFFLVEVIVGRSLFWRFGGFGSKPLHA